MFNLISCCPGLSGTDTKTSLLPPPEKLPLLVSSHLNGYTSEESPSYRRHKVDVAADTIDTLYSGAATSSTSAFRSKLETIVHEAGWWDKAIAEHVLIALERALEAGREMNTMVRQAYDKAVAEAEKCEEFAADHPILTGVFLTIVVLGILYLLWPEVLAALGFGEEGITLGSFAARWQFLYPNVPVGSVFAFLQRLGMTLRSEL